MPPTATNAELDEFVEAFETAHQRHERADLNSFLPPAGHPHYLSVLRELVCVDLDYGWDRGEPTPLDDYRRRFPALFSDPTVARAVVWEDYRQRRQAGQDPDPDDYQRRFGVNPVESREAGTSSLKAMTFPAGAASDGGEGPPTRIVSPDGRMAPPPIGAAAADWAARLDGLGAGTVPGAADLYRAVHESDPDAAERYARAMAALPRVGETFAGFRLEAELGRGAFGRVFLARQIALADRPVALKIAAELFGEDQTLARLQHTNIVPILSPHRVGPLQALAMPYDGGTTLADVFKALGGHALPISGKHFVSTLHGRKNSTMIDPATEVQSAGSPQAKHQKADAPPSPKQIHSTEAIAALERFSYPEAVLWLGARLADGLAHAHERGIVHRDLKPANILLKDDGQPMLLDFNLADTAALRHSEAGARVGGTLPYMAPEQIRAFHHLGDRHFDGRADLYSLGLILFELLTGRTAFPAESDRGSSGVAKMLADRAGSPPRLRPFNSAVSPAAEAIIRRCLEPDPALRYQSARALEEDIERHLAHLPLKHTPEPSLKERFWKWSVRHPRLTSGSSVAVLAAAALIALGMAALGLHREVQRRDAADQLGQFVAQTDKVLPRLIRSLDTEHHQETVAAARNAVARYGVFDRDDWQTGPLVRFLPPGEQERLRGRVGEVLFLLAQAAAGQPSPADEALRFNDLAGGCFADGSRPRAWWEQRAALLDKLGDHPAAARAVAEAKQLEPRTPTDLYLAALRLAETGRFAEALPLLERATAADPQHFWAWFLRGNCLYFQGQGGEAARCYSVCISLDPTQARPYLNRSKVTSGQRDWVSATEDADRAAALDPDWVEAQIEAAQVRYRHAVMLGRPANHMAGVDELLAKAGDGLPADQTKLLKEAEARLTDILHRPDAPIRCYFHRADVRQMLGDKTGAAADRKQGFVGEPDDDVSWVTRGFNRPAREAEQKLDDFRRAERINPQSISALKNQANVLSGPLKRPEEALAALNRLLALYPELPDVRVSRAVMLARLGRSKEAVADAAWATAHSADPLVTYMAGGVYARTGDTSESLRLLASALTRGIGFTYLATDPELDPIRDRPEFTRLVEAVRTMQEFLKPAAKSPASR